MFVAKIERTSGKGSARFVQPMRATARPCPADFPETFIELGRMGCEDEYRAGRGTVYAWLEQCGRERLLALRAKYIMDSVRWGETRARPIRDCPPDFDLAYTHLGLKGCVRRYHAGWRTIVRWRRERGEERLIAARQTYARGYVRCA